MSEFTSDIEALEARERAAGRNDFSVFVPLPSSNPNRVIITHLERDMPVLGRSFLGFDVTGFQGMLRPEGILDTTSEVFAQVTTISDLFGAFRLSGSATPDNAGNEDGVIYLIARYEALDGSVDGYVTRLESIAMTRARQARRLADAGVELELAQTMASTDPLTGLLNRQGLVDVTELPAPKPGVLLFIDLDNFKTVNDEDGHAAGDRVLRRIGTALRSVVRAHDAVCRLGGDEFLVFLPCPIDRERIDELESQIIASVRSIDSRISASIGSAVRSPEHMLPIETLLRKSDAAMYADKRSKKTVDR